METFIAAKAFAAHPRYAQDRLRALASLDYAFIDEPIRDIVAALARRTDCFPLQSCCGHFVCTPGQDPQTLAPIPAEYSGPVRYRIAYIALCIENSRKGRMLRSCLEKIPAIAPDYLQYGSADWFWEQCVNTYVLQVEPARHKEKDEVRLDVKEARTLQKFRERFFGELRSLLALPLAPTRTG